MTQTDFRRMALNGNVFQCSTKEDCRKLVDFLTSNGYIGTCYALVHKESFDSSADTSYEAYILMYRIFKSIEPTRQAIQLADLVHDEDYYLYAEVLRPFKIVENDVTRAVFKNTDMDLLEYETEADEHPRDTLVITDLDVSEGLQHKVVWIDFYMFWAGNSKWGINMDVDKPFKGLGIDEHHGLNPSSVITSSVWSQHLQMRKAA